MAKANAIGSAGELIVQSRLLVREWTAGNVNAGGMANAPAIDILAAKGPRTIRIAVKTTGHAAANAQFSVTPNWTSTSLFKGDVPPDFVVFVWFTSRKNPDACRIFVVPEHEVERALRECYLHWHEHPRRDGTRRKRSKHTGFSWTGKATEGNIARGFADNWKKYEDAWNLLERDARG
jgi:hypothetical protein